MDARKLLLVACAAVYSTAANIPAVNNQIMPQINDNELKDNWLALLLNREVDEIRRRRRHANLNVDDDDAFNDEKLVKQARVDELKKVLFGEQQYLRRRRHRVRNRRNADKMEHGPAPPQQQNNGNENTVNEQQRIEDKESQQQPQIKKNYLSGFKSFFVNAWSAVYNQVKGWFKRWY